MSHGFHAPGPAHIAAFAGPARRYAQRLRAGWDRPHSWYRDTMVAVGGMTGWICAQWHLHARDPARPLAGLEPRGRRLAGIREDR